MSEYHSPSPHSVEGAYIAEFLASRLIQAYPNNWQSLFNDYRFYGESVEPEHHIFKFKGYLDDINEGDLYIEVPFSEQYKNNPTGAAKEMSDHEWLVLVEKKKLESDNPIWQLI